MTTDPQPAPQPCHVQLVDDADHFHALAAEAVLQGLREALAARRRASLAVPGGSSPGPVFDRLAQSPLEWSRVTVTLVDERMVDPTSPESNERLVRERLLTGLASASHFQPLEGEGLRALPLPLDVVLLGMGEDGHVASIFPGSPALEQALTSAVPCLDVPSGEGRPPLQPRRTLTLATINAACRRILLVPGQAKIDVYQRALRGGDPYLYPVAGVLSAPANLSILACLA